MGPEELREELKEAYRRLLNPLVRILIRNGVSATETTDLVRSVFVEAAMSDEFALPGRRISDTRIAILTGLTRKEVYKLRHQTEQEGTSSSLGRISRLITAWNQDPDFTGPYGLPLAIPFQSRSEKEGPCFTELVRRHSDDISARAMLDELVRTGLATVDDDGLIRNSGRTYIPSKLDPASIQRLGKIVSRLADTLDFNNRVEESSLGRYEREVTTDIGLTKEQYRQFNVYLRSKCQQLLETIDNWLANQEGRLTAHEKSDSAPRRESIMTGIGIFHFLDDELEKEGRRKEVPIEVDDDDDD